MDYQQIFKQKIKDLQESSNYRYFEPVIFLISKSFEQWRQSSIRPLSVG